MKFTVILWTALCLDSRTCFRGKNTKKPIEKKGLRFLHRTGFYASIDSGRYCNKMHDFCMDNRLIETGGRGQVGSGESCNFTVIQHTEELQSFFQPKIGAKKRCVCQITPCHCVFAPSTPPRRPSVRCINTICRFRCFRRPPHMAVAGPLCSDQRDAADVTVTLSDL